MIARVLAVALALLPMPLASALARSPAGVPIVSTMPHISIAAFGRGSPVVLIPGLSTPRDVWSGIAPQLAQRHRVLLVQINGFGGDNPGENLKPGVLDGVVADLHAYLKRQKLGPAGVIGHSIGGLVALMLATAHPADVRRAMIVEALPFIGQLMAPDATAATVEPQARRVRDAMLASYGQAVNPAAHGVVAAGLALKPESRLSIVAWLGRADQRVAAQALYEDITADLRPALPNIATPITVVYAWSNALPEAQATAIYRRAWTGASQTNFVPIGNSAHFVMLDQPAAFAAAVTTFLNDPAHPSD